MRSTHLRTAAAVTLAATLALTGCGADDDNDDQEGGVEDVQEDGGEGDDGEGDDQGEDGGEDEDGDD